MSKRIFGAFALISILTVAFWTGYGQKEKAMSASYEYQVIEDPIQSRGMEYGIARINELGAQGWEIAGFNRNLIFLKRAKR